MAFVLSNEKFHYGLYSSFSISGDCRYRGN
ncbi:hypothetical protein J2W57_003173 [Chryseobacterium ginsenosidimutans]|uniref:Uncharacterized protein n=1 Tax=Chryseobacterium geocarposphaerae TaxID=1416776 RepID=A0ABU1LHL7_9FLAO|nr:hypothetical protein [Chryseobacterium geocarposphaerae]MDR6699770.1 hypothetical protein [Chryseobacterium ginsenosidimutans]